LEIRHKQLSSDAHPLIRIRHFHAATDYTTILDWRNRVDKVVLEGLEIHVPPGGGKGMIATHQGNDETQFKFVIETIVADGTLLEIEPKQAGRGPLQFAIEKLTMHSVGVGQAMTFTARLTNAKPPGNIDTSGHFGPWQRDDPRDTPVSGTYTFQNANLAVFNGISGTLSSQGKYGGVLQHIAVDGTTDTPDFALKMGGKGVHLTTVFHSIVDGANGDTTLDPVDAKFGHSEFICRGGVAGRAGEKGKTVDLQAQTKYARMEDILELVMGGRPMVRGNTEFQSRIVIPPGKQQVIDKLMLDGHFHLTSAVFTDPKVSERLRTLSDRASGVSKAEENRGEGEQGNVASDLFAKFRLQNGVISLASLAFQVPGAHIRLAGDYNLDSTAIGMQGTFEMRAKLSQTQSGIKAVLLKPLDPLFEKDGQGFELPISIGGTREHPEIGVSAFHRKITIH
jgi:hypothetical protein